ncbi:hypothetical protein PSTG_01184 [Puccinia striiformis f. sp. tritici PST-78]|uniref:Uncharacterized protein n=1 Tax=Puccinia striiformis f. sp. tritici PST-78 TaxID=1165861 RepID=A0A0L0W2U0_9BASI|nr:hypothetical protein PSTG_01184 [Puccinia striiformis f. sp. tritici PST-78]
MVSLLSNGLEWTFQKKLCKSWKDGALWCMTKYKPVAKKVRPVNQPIPQALNPPLLRDPYKTPLTPHPPEFMPTERITEERLKVLSFGPKDFLWEGELKLFKHLIVKREQVLASSPEERGLLKHSYGLPYIIPVVDHVHGRRNQSQFRQPVRTNTWSLYGNEYGQNSMSNQRQVTPVPYSVRKSMMGIYELFMTYKK